MPMRSASAIARPAAALIAATLMLAGCWHGTVPATRNHDVRSQQGARHHAGTPPTALRAGLSRPASTSFYLSLGDSLAQGVQPSLAGNDVVTPRGYPDLLAARLQPRLPHLRLVKLGCPGETTVTMISGGICSYPAGSQLGQAVKFLRSHRGRTALVTIDIGGNDPNSCVLGQSPASILPCLSSRIPQTGRNLSAIMARLRSAAGPRVTIVGMTYYVPELGLWRDGQSGRRIAILTGAIAAGANQMMTVRYRHYGARVADVFAAFHTEDFGNRAKAANQPGQADRARQARYASRAASPAFVPPNVAAICALTWMCAQPPRGPNEHANDAGYRVIARAFWHALSR
jgi:lysophospholipase L1-like esterase